MPTTPDENPIRVSVIVPVYNPGDGFDDLIASLEEQTLRSDEFEVLLCNDGSSDETRERLDRVASAHPNIRALHLPHTGWPGTPRNHGIDAARGRYVFFSDQDDRIYPNGLRAMADFADKHHSDVLVAKVVGVGRRMPASIFRRDIPKAVLGRDPLLDVLTPHKMFRTAFLNEHGIRFPDGIVRLEDHLFVMRAYVAADTISVLASEPCYAWLRNEGSASAARIDPATYFPHLEAVLDVVDANVQPGPTRDKLLRHWYNTKILRRLEGKRVVNWPEGYIEDYLDVVTPIAQHRFTDGVEAKLPFPFRIRSALVRAERRDDVVRFARFEAGLTCRADLVSARWTRGGLLELGIEVTVTDADGNDLVIERVPSTGGDGKTTQRWVPPESLGADFVAPRYLDATRDLRRDGYEFALLDPETRIERRLPGRRTKRLPSTRAVLDPLLGFDRQRTRTPAKVSLIVRRLGWTFVTPLHSERSVIDGLGRPPFLAGRGLSLSVNDKGIVHVALGTRGGRVAEAAARAVRRPIGFGYRVAKRYLPHTVQRRIRDLIGRVTR